MSEKAMNPNKDIEVARLERYIECEKADNDMVKYVTDKLRERMSWMRQYGGKGGWHKPEECNPLVLSKGLRDNLGSGHWMDSIAYIGMMISRPDAQTQWQVTSKSLKSAMEVTDVLIKNNLPCNAEELQKVIDASKKVGPLALGLPNQSGDAQGVLDKINDLLNKGGWLPGLAGILQMVEALKVNGEQLGRINEMLANWGLSNGAEGVTRLIESRRQSANFNKELSGALDAVKGQLDKMNEAMTQAGYDEGVEGIQAVIRNYIEVLEESAERGTQIEALKASHPVQTAAGETVKNIYNIPTDHVFEQVGDATVSMPADVWERAQAAQAEARKVESSKVMGGDAVYVKHIHNDQSTGVMLITEAAREQVKGALARVEDYIQSVTPDSHWARTGAFDLRCILGQLGFFPETVALTKAKADAVETLASKVEVEVKLKLNADDSKWAIARMGEMDDAIKEFEECLATKKNIEFSTEMLRRIREAFNRLVLGVNAISEGPIERDDDGELKPTSITYGPFGKDLSQEERQKLLAAMDPKVIEDVVRRTLLKDAPSNAPVSFVTKAVSAEEYLAAQQLDAAHATAHGKHVEAPVGNAMSHGGHTGAACTGCEACQGVDQDCTGIPKAGAAQLIDPVVQESNYKFSHGFGKIFAGFSGGSNCVSPNIQEHTDLYHENVIEAALVDKMGWNPEERQGWSRWPGNKSVAKYMLAAMMRAMKDYVTVTYDDVRNNPNLRTHLQKAMGHGISECVHASGVHGTWAEHFNGWRGTDFYADHALTRILGKAKGN